MTGSYAVEYRVFNSNDDYHTSQSLTLTVHNADAWTYDPVARTLSHSSTPWVLEASSSGLSLTITDVRTRATSPCPLPLGDPVSGGYSIVTIGERPGTTDSGVFYGGFNDSYPGSYITSLTFPASLTTIGKAAFAYCRRLSPPFSLPPNVQYIGNYAFMGCANLTGLFRHGNLAPDGDFAAAIWRDPDDDGMATWEEYIAGTDPLDAASFFYAKISSNLDIHWWPDLLGERVYTVEGTESLTNPIWGARDENSRFFRVRVDLLSP